MYGTIQSLDISLDGKTIITAHTYGVIMRGKEYIDVKSMLIAGATFTNLKDVDEIVTGTPRELYNALCLLHTYGVIPDDYNPTIISYPSERASLTKMIQVHKNKGQTQHPKPVKSEPVKQDKTPKDIKTTTTNSNKKTK